MPETTPAIRVFISYSRKDADFVAQLTQALQSKGYDVFVDTEDISGGEEWKERLDQLVLGADAVAFVMSPDSVASSICDWEIQRTLELGKRIVPLLWRPLDSQSTPSKLAERNYIFFDNQDRFDSALTQLCNACDVDIGWVREHTRLVGLATRWLAANRGQDGLLRGAELKAARAWVAARAARAPEIPNVLQDYLAASELYEKRARGGRRGVAAAFGLLAVLLVAGATAFVTQNQWRPVVDAALGRYVYYDVLLPQSVREGIEINSRVMFNSIDVGAVQNLSISPYDSSVVVARVVMSADVPIRTDSTAEVRATPGGQGRLLIAISSGSPEAALLPGSHGQGRPPRLIAIYGDDGAAFMDRAAIYASESAPAQALADYSEAIRRDAQLAPAYHARAYLLLNANDLAAAAADDDRSIALEPANRVYLSAGCRSHALWGEQLDQALAHCDEALRIEPNRTDTLYYRGLVHMRRGEFQAAFADYDAGVREDAGSAGALYGRGLAQLRLGQSDAGRADIATATAQDADVATRFAAYGLAP